MDYLHEPGATIFNFITLELFALVALYNFVIIPMNAKATITRWENKMLAGDFEYSRHAGSIH